MILIAAAVVFPLLFFIPAPYGRHSRVGFGPSLRAPLAWALMEVVSLLGFAVFLARNPARGTLAVALPAALYLAHYTNRALIEPWRKRHARSSMAWLTVVMAIAFNLLNGASNGAALGEQPLSPRFFGGLALAVAGAALNLQSDAVLRSLRRPGESGYQIPRRGLFAWVSCPNYLGELVEWAGFALCAWNLPALAFFVFTAANLAPRAWAHHRWYQKTFADYPAERRALVPFVF